MINALVDLKRSRSELVAENMFLRQQLIVMERQVERPRLTQRDRQILVLLASWIRGWREALVVVKPDTLLSWHRRGFRLYWKKKSQARKGRPPTSPEIIALIERAAWEVDLKKFDRLDPSLEIMSLGLDSVALMEMLGVIEDELDIHLPEDGLESVVTVGDLVSVVRDECTE